MEKYTAAILILLLISIVLQQTLSREFGQTTAARTFKQEKERVLEVHCSRERSKAAWKVIEEHLMPFVEREKYQISSKCRLLPSNDLFRDQEEHKIHVDINDWKCGYCRKSFRAEKYLDQHFDNRHHNFLNVSDGKCLADLCGALRCDFVMNSKSPKTKCNPAAAAKNHHLCESLANSCFPLNQGPSASQLHELFLRQFCDAHTCSGKTKYFPKGGKKQASKYSLPGYVNTVLNVVASLLSYRLFISKRNETGKPSAEANPKNWEEDRIIVVNWHHY